MQSQRCVLCNVHGQPDKGFLVQSRKLENVPWITWKAGSAQRARCAKNQAHFTPCASHWQNIAVEWICSFTLNLGSIMLLLSTCHHSTVTWYIFICTTDAMISTWRCCFGAKLSAASQQPHAIPRAPSSHADRRVEKCWILWKIPKIRGLYFTLFQEKPPEKKLLLLADFIKTRPLL